MTLPTLYPGMVNSPSTTLTSSIDDDDTTIAVAELSVFPSADNIAVIGDEDEESPETIKYTGKSAASGAGNLTGVERAFQGTAQSWGSGTKIRRNFTEYDYDAICDNIVGHDHTGGAGAAITEGALSLSDVTTADASSSAHGFCPKLSDDETEVLNGAGEWTDSPHRASLARQAIINGNFDIWQRGTAFTAASTPANSDDTYLPDRWILLSDGNDIVDVSRESTVIPSTGSLYSLKAEVETANKKFGFLTILESADAKKLAGKTVSLSFQARTTVSKVIENLRAAVISWSSTADTVTSDVVSSWGAEGTNPTLAANWTYENTPANIAITTDFATYKVEGIAIDTANTANIGVFIWVDDTDAAVDDLLYLSQVQLCIGDIALPFEPKSYAEEFLMCCRYYYRIMEGWRYCFGYNPSTTYARSLLVLPVPMRSSPTLETTGTASDYSVLHKGPTMTTCSEVPYISISHNGYAQLVFKVASGLTAGDGSASAPAAAGSYLGFSAEL